MGLEGGLTQPLVIVGFNRLVILITYDMKYFTMDAVSLASILAQNRPSSHMCECFNLKRHTYKKIEPFVLVVISTVHLLL